VPAQPDLSASTAFANYRATLVAQLADVVTDPKVSVSLMAEGRLDATGADPSAPPPAWPMRRGITETADLARLTGKPVARLLTGAGGIGKTTLLRGLAAQALRDGDFFAVLVPLGKESRSPSNGLAQSGWTAGWWVAGVWGGRKVPMKPRRRPGSSFAP
jgi:hypothetical protein